MNPNPKRVVLFKSIADYCGEVDRVTEEWSIHCFASRFFDDKIESIYVEKGMMTLSYEDPDGNKNEYFEEFKILELIER